MSSSSGSEKIGIGCQLRRRFHSSADPFGGKRPARTVAIDIWVLVTPVVCAHTAYSANPKFQGHSLRFTWLTWLSNNNLRLADNFCPSSYHNVISTIVQFQTRISFHSTTHNASIFMTNANRKKTNWWWKVSYVRYVAPSVWRESFIYMRISWICISRCSWTMSKDL